MINVNTFRNDLLNNLNKWRSGNVPPSRTDNWLNQASTELFNEKRLAAFQNQKINDDLAPFLKSQNLPVEVPEGQNYGLVLYPSTEYNYFWSMRCFFTGTEENLTSCGCTTSDNSACDAKLNLIQDQIPLALIPIVKESRVTLVDASEWDSVLKHRTKFPTLDRPYATQFSGGFKIAPRNLSIVTLDNYRLPKRAKFGYTVQTNPQTGIQYYQYDESTSTQIEWNEQVKNELLDRVTKLASIYLKDNTLFQMAENLKNTRI